MVKKFVALLLCLLTLFSFCGCTEKESKIFESADIENLSLFVNNSYKGEKFMVYCLYTVKATENDIEFFYYTQNGSSIGSGATLTVNSRNEYDDLFTGNPVASKPFEITSLNSNALGQTVKKGSSVDFVSVFLVNKDDLTVDGKAVLTLVAKDGYFEQQEITISKINYIESAEVLARKISPDGKTEEELLKEQEIEKIDGELLTLTEKALEGSWEYEYDGIKSEMTFSKGSFKETKTKKDAKKPFETLKGTYSVRKKVILVTLNNGEEKRIPYTYQNEKLTISFEF